ncbi:uncharacterized protein LACBIDRAFT_310993 [Laccaria bicolor S238N-H82]|uniref:Predicted protein n=1 Tax=Laccaria bicolor (strain S238N-H82 / ATCC MYA-4686) TaxID=486041 RepID=B0DVH6_LACBS|nr:uncharacterized protein LACBIDRAFT_310993 [Laccaria bicolor S238N-H82]EDR01388.1 predicted protein [Laccaria bicolor S238N-H82]|eukprot:XP_001887933.1 predicted protein [Laccaria bicolor S238N-H82]
MIALSNSTMSLSEHRASNMVFSPPQAPLSNPNLWRPISHAVFDWSLGPGYAIIGPLLFCFVMDSVWKSGLVTGKRL